MGYDTGDGSWCCSKRKTSSGLLSYNQTHWPQTVGWSEELVIESTGDSVEKMTATLTDESVRVHKKGNI